VLCITALCKREDWLP